MSGPVQEKIVRVKDIVTQEFERGPVILIAAFFCDDADIRSHRTSERCIVKRGLHLELFQRIGIGNWDSPACRTCTLHVAHTDSV